MAQFFHALWREIRQSSYFKDFKGQRTVPKKKICAIVSKQYTNTIKGRQRGKDLKIQVRKKRSRANRERRALKSKFRYRSQP